MELLTNRTSFLLGNIHANAHILQHDHNRHLQLAQQLFSNAKAALAVDQLDDAQRTLTLLNTCIRDDLLPACLALRAYTCQRQQAYAQGAVLADQYIEQKQHDPDGYLLAGNMRLLSGDSETALQTYRTGIQHSSSGRPQYWQLINQRNHMEQQVSRSNTRLIRILPREVLSVTLSLLRWKELAALASACRAWHKLVLDWPGTWREITINNIDDLLPGRSGQQFLARAPPQHVRKLSFTDPKNTWYVEAYKEITRYNWNHLEELSMCVHSSLALSLTGNNTLEIDGDDTADAHNYMGRSDTAVSIIRNCKDTLKRLTLVRDRGRVLNYSLENCRDLEYLSFIDCWRDTQYPLILEAGSNLLPLGPFPVRELFIRCDRTNVDIAALVSQCPQLEGLHVIIYSSNDLGILRTLCNHCPQLQTLQIESNDGFGALSPPLQQRTDDVQGLRKLIFHDNAEYAKEELVTLIHNNRHSLEILDIEYMSCAVAFYNLLVGTQLDNLRVLYLAYEDADEVLAHLLKAIIEASPSLQQVYIPDGAASDVALTALGRLPNLIELAFSVDEPVTLAGLDALFSRTQSLRQATLMYTDTSDSHVSFYQTLRLIAGCKTLRHLEIRTEEWLDISDTLEAQNFKNHIELQQSNLQKVTVASNGEAIPLYDIPLWSNFKQLQHMDINYGPCCPFVPWAECASTFAQIGTPNLKITCQQGTRRRVFQLDSDGSYHSDIDDDSIVGRPED